MKPNKTISEFKEFIAKGNVMDMAVGENRYFLSK